MRLFKTSQFRSLDKETQEGIKRQAAGSKLFIRYLQEVLDKEVEIVDNKLDKVGSDTSKGNITESILPHLGARELAKRLKKLLNEKEGQDNA